MTGATISGTSSTVCTIFWPAGKTVVEHQRDRQAEHQRAGNGGDHETEGIGKNDVAEFRVAEDVKVVGESDPGPLGIMQRPIAKAGIGSRENGDDLE